MDNDTLRGFYQGQHVSQCERCAKELEEALGKIVSSCPELLKSLKEMQGN